ncbi:leucine-rich repeat flightless-interacting protein 2 isoform X3 [Entelurus aequoreus]|uniref:leucine-rich repeat flightless-interacting protein 2 isoform X3 n=1 Tax=Entelurus aequoreus TaxID=161455 RepID=UPI002B1DD68F|nr:leucine-rich repeat flightless-interacting protein 2 isoform X3 [Entelurus aequoreus]
MYHFTIHAHTSLKVLDNKSNMSNNKSDMSNMGSQVTGRKRSSNKDRSTAEDEALNLIAKEAEARLAAKRAARAEAREIRMRELERQQKEIFQVQKKYYGLDSKLDDRVDDKWGDIEQWMEDSERYSRPSQLSDDDEHMSVGVRGSSLVLHKKSKKKKKHKHKRNGCDDDEYSVVSSRSSKLSDDSKVSRSSRGDLLSLEYSSYPRSRSSSRNSSARASPVDQCASVATFLRRAASSNALTCNLDQVSIPDFSHSSSAASTITATTITSLGASSSRTGSGETLDAESAVREIKEIHELKDQIQDVESKYTHNLKEAKDALTEVEEKYRKAMVSNAQLDNDKNNLMYQVDTLKDSLMELEELLSESRREYQDKVKELEREKHAHNVLHFQLITMKESLQQSEELLNKHGVVLSINGGAAEMDAAISSREDCSSSQTEVNCMLEIRLRKLVDEREKMIEQIQTLKDQLGQKNNGTDGSPSADGEVVENGKDPNMVEGQTDSSRQITDMKFKLVKAEQEVTALQQNVSRLEGQVMRYKSAAESAEKVEDELKAEKRKLQRELRSALDKLDELESNNKHLNKRLEKIKSSRGLVQSP